MKAERCGTNTQCNTRSPLSEKQCVTANATTLSPPCRSISPFPLGVYVDTSGIRISMVSDNKECGIRFYDKASGELVKEVSLADASRLGKVRYTRVEDVDKSRVVYQLYVGDKVVPDERGRVFEPNRVYGEKLDETLIKTGFLKDDYDWQGDVMPRIPYEDCIVYCMHVRGFTMHPSSGVKHKGTFEGVAEKIPYLKKLGITTVEMQPVYEFQEVESDGNYPVGGFCATKWNGNKWIRETPDQKKINYWGYKRGCYFAPKSSYAAFDDPSASFRSMVREFHKNGMEVVLQFYFPAEVPGQEIPEILHFWVQEYHVDGFHLMGQQLPNDWIVADAGLSDTKLWLDYVNDQRVYSFEEIPQYRNLAIYNDEYMYDMRPFLKGDGCMLEKVQRRMRENPLKYGRINYFTNYYGFTMMDMVSYNDKHNEANGEDNRDGNPYNQSWNCGEEGPSRNRQVNALRSRQYKNAMSMLFLSQSTPLIFMGDEFGNSQKGNNNPYCQDNEITWLNWKDKEKHKELYQFTEKIIALRKAHPILHNRKELRLMDYYAYGYPDLSYHGAEAWLAAKGSNDRQIGMLYCGKYAKINKRFDDDFFYVALNMHWESKELALPKLPKGMTWELCYTTGSEPELCEMVLKVPPRTVAVYQSKKSRE